MEIINLFLIILILYLIYKIFIQNEHFTDKIDLSDKNIINSKNIFINMDESQLEEINKLSELDLSKNNLIIDNRKSNNVSIKDKLCVGTYCINSDKLKTLTGDIDGPQFYKTKNGSSDEPVYYNHNCDIGVDNSNSFKCNINKNIDYPDKLCFNNLNEDPTCIGPNEFDMLKGVRGIKLKHDNSQKNTEKKYMTPYYMDFKQSGYGIEGSKDQLFFKNNDECLSKELLKENKVNLNNMNYKELIHFTQDPNYSGCFNQTKLRDYGRKKRASLHLLSKLKKDIDTLWIISTTTIVAATAGAAAILVSTFGLAGPLYIAAVAAIPTYAKLIKVDIPNIETIMADIKTEYDNNWWNGSNIGGKKYPYYQNKNLELNCENVDCTSTKKFMCPHKCRNQIKMDDYCKSINGAQGGCLDASNIVMMDGNDGSGNIGHSPHIHGAHALDSSGNITNSKFTHGYYILNNEFYTDDLDDTKHKTIDPDYNGFYLSKLNNNIKYKLKENAISRVSKFLGDSLNTHRITGDPERCNNIDEVSNRSYYCSGKNSGDSDKDSICNPVKFNIDNNIKCVNEKISDNENVVESEDDNITPPHSTLHQVQALPFYNICVNENSDSLTSSSQQANSESDNKIQPIKSPSNETLNYVMTPAKDSNGNNIKANTYFHGHFHIH